MSETGGRILDLSDKLAHGQLSQQLQEVFGVDNEPDDVIGMCQESMARGNISSLASLNRYGLESGVIEFFNHAENQNLRKIELIPGEAVDVDLTELDGSEEMGVHMLIRPSFFGKFQHAVSTGLDKSRDQEIRQIGVDTGCVFICALTLTKQLTKRLAWQTQGSPDLHEVLLNNLETGLRSYYKKFRDFADLDDIAIRDYRESALLPRLAATVAYDYAISEVIEANGQEEPTKTNQIATDMLTNRFEAAARTLQAGISPSPADIGMAKPLTISETTRVLKGLSLLSERLSSSF